MQVQTQIEHSERDFEFVAGEPLPGSGFEYEDVDPEFSGEPEPEEPEGR
jgi:hypothetical protein